MKLLINKPHFTFIILTVILVVLRLLAGNGALDLNVHDTMYVISYKYLSFLLIVLSTIISISYGLMDYAGMKYSNWLVLLQILLTIPFIIVLVFSISKNLDYFADLRQQNKVLFI